MLKLQLIPQQILANGEYMMQVLPLTYALLQKYYTLPSHSGDVSSLKAKQTLGNCWTRVSPKLDLPYAYISFLLVLAVYTASRLCRTPSGKLHIQLASKSCAKLVVSFVDGGSGSSEFIRVLQRRAENMVWKRERHKRCVAVSK